MDTILARLGQASLIILDIDGLLRRGDYPIVGAGGAVSQLRRNGVSIRLLTNDGWSCRRSLCRDLNSMGVSVHEHEIYTAASLAADEVRKAGAPPTLLLSGGESEEEFAGINLTKEVADAVVVGDYFECYDSSVLNTAFLSLMRGALFLAMQRNRYWPGLTSPVIDCGFWVAGLEYCVNRQAHVVGKPSEESYLKVCSDASTVPHDAVMISDDPIIDLTGAKRAGLLTVQATQYTVASGIASPLQPDHIVFSLADYVKDIYG